MKIISFRTILNVDLVIYKAFDTQIEYQQIYLMGQKLLQNCQLEPINLV